MQSFVVMKYKKPNRDMSFKITYEPDIGDQQEGLHKLELLK